MEESSIHSLLKVNLKDVLLERIESSANTGTADCNATSKVSEWWMEYKVVGHKSKASTIPVKCSLGVIWLRPAQMAWHASRTQYASRAFVVGRTEDAIVVLRLNRMMEWEELFVTRKPFNYEGLRSVFEGGSGK